MPVIPFPQRHRNGEPAAVRPLNREARIHGTFRSPSGGLGTMTGSLRLERLNIPAFARGTAVVRRPRLCNLAGGLDSHQRGAASAPALALVAPAPATAPPPGLVPVMVPVVAPVVSAVALKRRSLGSRS